MKCKKVRGQRRRLKRLLYRIEELTPFSDTDTPYEHFHVPSDLFISSPKTSGRIKTAFCRAWLNKTAEIMAEKPKALSFCKVVACIHENDLWQSQIIIFYDEEYYTSFWKRDDPSQTWIPFQTNIRSFSAERNINTLLMEKGYYEVINDEDGKRSSVLWFFGDVPLGG